LIEPFCSALTYGKSLLFATPANFQRQTIINFEDYWLNGVMWASLADVIRLLIGLLRQLFI
jgi:hypothetical protein